MPRPESGPDDRGRSGRGRDLGRGNCRRRRGRGKETGVNEVEQTLLFAATGIVLLGTLIVFVWQYFRNRD
jgi:hypothetical protein